MDESGVGQLAFMREAAAFGSRIGRMEMLLERFANIMRSEAVTDEEKLRQLKALSIDVIADMQGPPEAIQGS